MTNEYDELVRAYYARQDIFGNWAAKTRPEEQASILRDSRTLGLPPEIVAASKEKAAEAAKQKRIQSILEKYPAVGPAVVNAQTAASILVEESDLAAVGRLATTLLERYPKAEQFRITKQRGFKEASQQLMEARRRWERDVDAALMYEAQSLADAELRQLRSEPSTIGRLVLGGAQALYGTVTGDDEARQAGNRELAGLLNEVSTGLSDAGRRGLGTLAVLGDLGAAAIDRALTAIGSLVLPVPEGMTEEEVVAAASKSPALTSLARSAALLKELPQDKRLAVAQQIVDRASAEGRTMRGVVDAALYLMERPDALVNLLAESLVAGAPGFALGPAAGAVTGRAVSSLVSKAAQETAAKQATMAVASGAGTFAQTLPSAYAERFSETQDHEDALNYALAKAFADAGVNALLTAVPLPQAKSAVANVLAEAARQGTAGAAGAAAGSLAVGEPVSVGEMFLEFIAEILTAPVDVALAKQQAKALALQNAAVAAEQAAAAQAYQNVLNQAGEILAEAKALSLGQEGREAIREAVEQIAGDRPVYIEAGKLLEALENAGINPETLSSPEIAARAREQAAIGGVLDVPVSDFMATFAATPVFQELLEHVKQSPQAPSAFEAQQLLQEKLASLDTTVRQVFEQNLAASEFARSSARVYETVLAELNSLGRFSEGANKAYAQLHQLFFSELARSLGVTPEQAFKMFPHRFVSEGRDPTAYDQLPFATFDDFTPENIGSILQRDRWAIFTAENPMGKAASQEENAYAQALLRQDLERAGYKIEQIVGKYVAEGEEETAPLEHPFLVIGITPEEAMEYAKKYRQDSILTRHGLIYQDWTVTPARGVIVHNTEPPNYWSRVPSTGATFTVDLDFDRKVPYHTLGQPVSTRLPSKGNPHIRSDLAVDIEEAFKSQKYTSSLAEYTKTVPWFKPKSKDPRGIVREFIEEIKSNLRTVYEAMEPSSRDRAGLFYYGAHEFAKALVERHGGKYTLPQVSAVIAVFSPQNPFESNISDAERLIDLHANPEVAWSSEMDAALDGYLKPGGKPAKQEFVSLLKSLRGKKFSEVDGYLARAWWFKIYNRAHLPKRIFAITPEGGFSDETRYQGMFSADFAARALRVLDDGRQETISRALGDAHKVRNFYNNIFDPFDPRSVTIDTHAVAVALLLPVAGTDKHVVSLFNGPKSAPTGHRGTYVIFAEAYRELAAEYGLLPQELQAMFWAGARSLFAEKRNIATKFYEHVKGAEDAEAHRKAAISFAGGPIRAVLPPGAGISEGSPASSYRRELRLVVGRERPALSRDRGVLYQGVGRPPVNPDGTITLYHYSRAKNLTELNPARYGTGLGGAERARKQADPDNWLNRTYYGIAVGQPGGYVKEAGLGDELYIAHVPAEKLYDFAADPDGLRPKQVGGWDHPTNVYERRIKEAGYLGYWVNDPSLGLTAALFSTQKVEKAPAVMPQGDTRRGFIALPEDIRLTPTVIALLEKADLSTFLHESGHFFFEIYRNVATQVLAKQRAGEAVTTGEQKILRDMEALLAFVADTVPELKNPPQGTTALDIWNSLSHEQRRAGHERIATGFEAYLFEGSPPAPELRGLFARFRAWLMRVYRSLLALNVRLTAEVRAVFDRMLVSEELIQRQLKVTPLFKTESEAVAAGLTAEEWQDYQDAQAAIAEEAIAELQSRSLRDMTWVMNARNKTIRKLTREAAALRKSIREEVENEVYQEPVYATERFLRRGILPDGAQVTGAKLDIDALREMYGDGPAAPWRYLGTGAHGLVGKEGLHPDIVAEMFGFDSGDALVRALLEAEPAKERIDALVNQRMIERHAELADPDAIEAAALRAIHNVARAKFVATEMAALAKAARIPRNALRLVEIYVESKIAGTKIRNLRPAMYERAEQQAAAASEKALRNGDTLQAAIEKRNQYINLRLAKETAEAAGDVEAGLRYLARFKKASIREKIDPEYLKQIDLILDNLDARRSTTLREIDAREAMRKWIERQREQGIEPLVDEDVLDIVFRRSYKEMTVGEFRTLIDSVKHIEHLGRGLKKLLTAMRNAEFAEARDKLVDSIRANANRTVAPKAEFSSAKDRLSEVVKQFFAAHRKFASIINEMDGGKAGVGWELLVWPMNKAGDKETVMRAQAAERLAALFAQLGPVRDWHKKTRVPSTDISLSREARIMLALNWGNEANRQRVLDGGLDGVRPLRQDEMDAILDTLTKEEWDFVQGVWDFLDEYRPLIAEQEYRINGVEPKWVEPSPVETKFGTYRGGYFPIKYEGRLSTRSAALEAATDLRQAMKGLFGRASTRDSYTKARVAEVKGRPVRKDFGVIAQHLNEVIHRLSWEEYLIDARRLINDKQVDRAIRDHYGPEILREMRDFLADMARGELPPQGALDPILRHMRVGVSIAGMGWNVVTALLQVSGLSQSAAVTGVRWLAEGLRQFALNPSKTIEDIHAKSDFMRMRSKTINREINEILNTVAEGEGVTRLKASYFWLISKLQYMVDAPTWLGAYEKALADLHIENAATADERAALEEKAIALADQAVIDSQGSGMWKDLSAVQRGSEALRLFTNFYSYFNVTYNLAVQALRTKNAWQLPGQALLLFVIPAAYSVLMQSLLRGKCEDEDIECLAKALGQETIAYTFGTMILVRELSSIAQGYTGYTGPPGTRVFAEFTKLATQVSQGEVDMPLVKAAIMSASIPLHLPGVAISRIVEGGYNYAEGDVETPLPMLVGMPEQ